MTTAQSAQDAMTAASDPRLIVPLDVPTVAEARALVDRLGEAVSFYKVGLQLFASGGMELARALKGEGKQVFLDWKLHDIGATVEKAAAALAVAGCDLLTVHGEPQVMKAAVRGRKAAGGEGLNILAVTVMTSLTDADLDEMGYAMGVEALVERRIRQALACGCDGVVASPHEAAMARALAREAAARLTERLARETPEEALAEALAGDLRLAGDLITYDHPANADLIAVAQRRKGLPVALGVFYIEAARRCGLDVRGVDFPGHFLLRIETVEGPMALDPFSEGRVVLPSELTRRALRTGLTPDVAADLDALMRPVSDRAVAIRLQNNVFARAAAAHDYARAERSALRRALLDPADHRPWIDVAAAREGQGALAGALQALSRAQMLDGGASIAARVARERVRLRLN